MVGEVMVQLYPYGMWGDKWSRYGTYVATFK